MRPEPFFRVLLGYAGHYTNLVNCGGDRFYRRRPACRPLPHSLLFLLFHPLAVKLFSELFGFE